MEAQTLRLLLSRTLARHARKALGGRIEPGIAGRKLEALALRLRGDAHAVEARYNVQFRPSYPGVTAGVERLPEANRLLLACQVLDVDGAPVGLAYTVLIAGREPNVSVAEPEARLPAGWQPLPDAC